MSALAAGKKWQHRGQLNRRELVAGATDVFYEGAVLGYASGGGVTPVIGAGTVLAGICLETISATSGTTRVPVSIPGGDNEWLLPYASAALTDEGTLVDMDISAASDNPADLILDSAGATGDLPIGTVTEYVSSTAGGWVRLGAYALPAAHS